MQLRSVPEGSRVRLSVEGEIDFSNRDAFEAEMQRLAAQVQEIDVDFAGVTFIDSSGVSALLGACSDAANAGVKVQLQNIGGDLLEVLDILGVKEILPIA